MSHPRFHFVQAHGKVLLFTLLISLSFPIGSASPRCWTRWWSPGRATCWRRSPS
ncbi:hypothetical protein [Aeromonas hydrophila]|uniref:hypothetical protein n=1 Tax=Aeromonas hydrophila TaxID=644 RepID=UPI001F2BF5DB|nr:hypothetical protein [Aeromonas hydrophila]